MRATFLVFFAAGCAGHPAGAPHDGGATRITDDGHGTFTMATDHFVVAPAEERYRCQDFANPFGGAAAAIGAFVSHLTPGSHHLLVFYKPGAVDAAPADCRANEFAPGPYGSQRPDDALAYPPGVAAVVAPGDGFRVQVHYLNATPSPVEVGAEIRMTRIAAAAVRDHAGILFFSNLAIDVPPGAAGAVARKSCTLPFAVNLIQATGHMHEHGRDFAAAVAGGQTLFYSSAWADVAPALYDPPLPLPAGSIVTFACTYDNRDGATALVYGDSARANEMCIFSAQFYPAPFGGWSCL